MTQEEAIDHLWKMMIGIQRVRAMATGVLPTKLLEELHPWTFSDKCPLEALSKLIDRAEKNHDLAPMDFYNMMFVVDRFMPELLIWGLLQDYRFPEPDISWIKDGWDES